mgnify:CR=1 FL=1
MKIYCILMDTVPRHGKIRDAFNSIGISSYVNITADIQYITTLIMVIGRISFLTLKN